MTRQEILELLKMLRSAYPNAKIRDASELVKTWEMAFGNDQAEKIYKAARFHVESSPYFPTIGDIRHAINKGELLYGSVSASPNRVNLEAKRIDPKTSFCDLCGLCDKRDQSQCEF